MKRDRIEYKEFIIDPCPYEVKEPKGWCANTIIEAHPGDRINEEPISLDKIFDTREEALKHSILMAKRYIDDGKADFLLSKNPTKKTDS